VTGAGDSDDKGRLREAADRVVELEAELEASGSATLEEVALARQRAILHDWVDTITGVVSTPGVGRVVLIHKDGKETRIASSDLPFKLAIPVNFAKQEDS
jgi:hypothetical protein